MTSIARKKGNEGDAIMAHAAIPATKDFAHRNRVGSGFGNKWSRVAIRAVQPNRMGLVGKAHIRHFLGVSHHHVKVEHIHLVRRRKARPGRNDAGTQGSHPVRKAYDIALHVPRCVVNPLQPRKIRVGLVIYPVALKRGPRRVQFRNRSCANYSRGILHRRHIGCGLQKRQDHGLACEGNTHGRSEQQEKRSKAQCGVPKTQSSSAGRVRH